MVMFGKPLHEMDFEIPKKEEGISLTRVGTCTQWDFLNDAANPYATLKQGSAPGHTIVFITQALTHTNNATFLWIRGQRHRTSCNITIWKPCNYYSKVNNTH